MPDLLIELFSEEIPARMQAKAAADLQRLVTDGLVEAGLTYAGAAAFHTPRRLTLSVNGLTAESAAVREERKGPKADAPEKAIEGFLRSTGLTRDQLEEREDKKGTVLFAVIERPGRKAAEIVAEVLDSTVRGFPWPKSMRWGAGALRWVRPLHSIICLLSDEAGAEVVPLDIDGIVAGDVTQGHRFLSSGGIKVTSFEDYEAKLKQARVVLRAEERADAIWHDATNQAFAAGLEVVEDKGLLAEVAGLVEWPVVLMGEIGAEFLELPPEVLQTSMKEHQKFFSVRDKTGKIVRFITVANMETADNGATILAGNGKVLAARLADAKFFWENDLRVARAGMQPWLDAQANVTFHNKLGSQKDLTDRIVALAREIAPVVGADADEAAEAARFAKADLASEMVYEFPDLQGLMGRYYAKEAGLSDAIAAAAQEHYSPLGPSDDVPTAPVSVAVSLAEKLDKLAGFWAIDEKPTGSKDPFALRRAALGVIRLVLENGLRLPLCETVISGSVNTISLRDLNDLPFDVEGKSFVGDDLKHVLSSLEFLGLSWKCVSESKEYQVVEPFIEAGFVGLPHDGEKRVTECIGYIRRLWLFASLLQSKLYSNEHFKNFPGELELYDEALPTYRKIAQKTSIDLLSFLHDRLKVFLRDKGISHDVIEACLQMPGNDDLTLLVKRAEALAAFMKTDDGENLIQGFKRANNILTQAEEKDGVEYSYGADMKYAEEDAEKALFKALDDADAAIQPAMAQEDFNSAMQAMAALRGPIDAFFTEVQVNDDRQVVRRNRLNLLSRIRNICLSVADLTRLEG